MPQIAGPNARTTESPLAPGLYIVATPIGNLEDITLRALRILREVDLIACEDTRHTQKLLNHFDIKTPMQSYHQHNEAARAAELVANIEAGKRIALVSDAGMPGISDPGERVIRAAVERGLTVISVPGPSAMISALVASGLSTASFRFAGFLPARSGERRTVLEGLAKAAETMVFYEAPHRIVDMLADLGMVFGADRRIVIARELTKVHEEFLRGSIAEVRQQMESRPAIKGEMTVIVSGAHNGTSERPTAGLDLPARVRELMNCDSLDEKTALKQAAREFGMSKSEAYREWQRSKIASPRRHGKDRVIS